jgi:hypothetical protein
MSPQQIADRIAGFQIVGHFRRLRSRTKQRLDRRDIISGIAMPAIHGAVKGRVSPILNENTKT